VTTEKPILFNITSPVNATPLTNWKPVVSNETSKLHRQRTTSTLEETSNSDCAPLPQVTPARKQH